MPDILKFRQIWNMQWLQYFKQTVFLDNNTVYILCTIKFGYKNSLMSQFWDKSICYNSKKSLLQ